MRILTESEIRKLYSMQEAIQDLKKALIHHKEGKIENPQRTVLDFPEQSASILYMPSAWQERKFACVKVVSIFPNNPEKKKKTTQGIILLTDTETGDHLACMDASYLTRLRTGALSAIATEYLAKRSAQTLAVIGCGRMAEEQVQGVLAVRNIQTIILFNRTLERTKVFAEKIRKQNPRFNGNIEIARSAEEAVQQAEIINCATRSEKPVFSGKFLQTGSHINGIGSYLPHMQEVDEIAVLRATKIVVDTLEGVKQEAGDLIIPAKKGIWRFEQIYGQLDRLVAGEIPGRENDEEVTFFKSVGAAYFDLAVAQSVYKKAVEHDVGIEQNL